MIKRKIGLIIALTTLTSAPLHAFWGAAYYATKGPSIPKVMQVGQTFTKNGKTKGENLCSSDNSIISVKTTDSQIIIVARKVGQVEVAFKSTKTGKSKEKKKIIVAYNNLSDIPSRLKFGQKVFIKASTERSEAPIMAEDQESVMIIRKKISNKYFYEVRFHKDGKVTLLQNGNPKTITVAQCSSEADTKKTRK